MRRLGLAGKRPVERRVEEGRRPLPRDARPACAWPSSASTRACTTPTSPSSRRSTTAASPTACAWSWSSSRARTWRTTATWTRRSGSATGCWCPAASATRGIEGMIRAARWAREKKVPYLGICLGMQIMVIEYARSVLGLEDAHSTEFSPDTTHPVVSLLEEQVDIKAYGGTMRLGRSDTHLAADTKIARAYGAEVISERHRHRYEVSNQYRNAPAGGRPRRERAHPRRLARGVRGVARSPVGRGGAVPPRVQVQTPRAQPAVLQLHRGLRGGGQEQRRATKVNRAAALPRPARGPAPPLARAASTTGPCRARRRSPRPSRTRWPSR